VLEPIWLVYKAVMVEPNSEQVARIIKSQGLVVANRELNHTDRRVAVQVPIGCNARPSQLFTQFSALFSAALFRRSACFLSFMLCVRARGGIARQ
jgi:hypothetical protein